VYSGVKLQLEQVYTKYDHMKPHFYLLIGCLLLFPVLKTTGQDTADRVSVLVVLDVQQHFTAGTMSGESASALLENVNEAIRLARPHMEVVFIKANVRMLEISFKGINAVMADSQALDLRLNRKAGDRVFTKNEPSGFSNDSLTHYLDSCNVERIYLAGLYIEACLGATAIDGLERGYEMVLIDEAAAAKKERRRERKLASMLDKGVEVICIESFRKER